MATENTITTTREAPEREEAIGEREIGVFGRIFSGKFFLGMSEQITKIGRVEAVLRKFIEREREREKGILGSCPNITGCNVVR